MLCGRRALSCSGVWARCMKKLVDTTKGKPCMQVLHYMIRGQAIVSE